MSKACTFKNPIPFYVEYTDTTGLRHYAVHQYDRISGWVWQMKDYKFV